jgi:hypothetical protein
MNAITKGYEDVPMSRRRAQLLAEYADKLADMLENAPDDRDLAEWVQSKIDRAAAAIQSAYHYLDQEEDENDELEKAAGHKYTHRKRVGTDKRGRARYRYYYQEHHGGGITSAKFEAGSSFKLTYKGRRGHFHIQSVEGDMVTITHDGRPGMQPVSIHRDELRALLKKQHGKALEAHVEKRRREVEALDRDRSRKRSGLGLALHRLRQAADKAGISLPEQYQRQPKKTRAKVAETAREVETPRDQLTSTAQQIIEEVNQEHEERHEEHQEITRFELGEHTHTKTGQKLFTAKQKERTDRDEYFRRVEIAKKYRGRYERRYVKGFVFRTAEDARAFALEIEGVAQAPEASAETVTPHEDHPSADNFETMPEVESAPRSKTEFREKIEELKRLEYEQQTFTGELYRPQGLTKEQEKDILDKMQAKIAKKRDELTEGFIRPQSSEELETRLKSFLPTLKGLDYNRIDGYRLYVDGEHRASLRTRIKDLVGIGLNISPAHQKNYGLNVAGTFKDLVRLLFALENEAQAKDTPQPEQPTTPREQLTETAREARLNVKQIRAREAIKRARGAQTRIKASNRADKLTATGRRARASINADKLLIEAIERIMDQDYREMERPLPSDINQRTPQQDNFAKLRGALNNLKSSQTLTRGSWTDDHESLKKKRIKARSEIEDALKDLETRSQEELQTQIQVNIEDLPPKGQRTAEDAKRFFGEPRKNEAIKRVTYERDGHIVTGPASGRGKGKFRYDLSLPRERFRNEPLLATAQSSNEIGTYDTLDEALTAAINQYEPSDQIIDRMIESAKEDRERTARRMGATTQPTRTAHTIVLDRLIEAKRSGNEAQEAQVNEQLRPQLLNLLEKLEQGTLDDGERQALLTKYQELETLTTGAGKELAQEIVSRLRGADNFETMPETDTQPAPDPSPARAQLAETVREISEPKSPLNIDQANAQDTLTENRTRAPESKAADKALIESARELAKTSERGEEIKSALVDLMNAQQLKRYKRATGDMSARAEDMIEKRREARERLRAATSGEVINNFETMPETEAQPKKRTGPDISRYKRALSLAKKGKRLDKLTNGRRSKASREADQALISLAQEILEKDLGDVEVRTIYRKPSTMWTREESLKVAIGAMAGELKTRQRAHGGKGGADQAQELRVDAREKLIEVIQEHVDRFLPDEVIDARLERDLARDARETAKQEAREAQEARQYQQKTFTPEIQGAIDTLKFGIGLGPNRRKSYAIENFFKTRKDGGVYKTTKTPAQLAESITENLPENIAYLTDFGENTLRTLLIRAINEGVEARETPAELKDRIGSVITQRAQDNAASQKAQITGDGQRKALLEMRRNINTLSGTGHFDEYRRRGERSYMGLGAIEKTLGMSERLSDLYVDAIFRQALPPELERFKAPITRFEPKAADQVAGAFANKYETVGEIRDNISTIREQMRATIKTALDKTTNALVKRPVTLDLINQSYEKATERLNTDRQKNIENARALAQYTDNPQAHLAEIQELERQSDQAIAEQMEINSEFARAYIHEASDLVERALETTKGEVIDNVMSVKTPMHADKFTATVRGKANRKLMARIFNEVFEQVRREIGDEPIEQGENHPRNIADTVQKPSKTPAQFRADIERAREEKRAQARAKREEVKARSATTVQKSLSAPKLTKMITYRAQLIQTVERLTA